MDFADVVRQRRMVRNYTDEPVDPKVIDIAIANATLAPNAGFSQGWDFVVLDRADSVRSFWEATADDLERPDRWLRGMMRAPVIVIPCSDESAYVDRYSQPDKTTKQETSAGAWAMPYWHLDTAMASLLILQTATAHGLGSCFFGIPADRYQGVREVFGIPETSTPIGAITIGHPAPGGAAGSPARRQRRTNVIHRNGWTG